MSTGSFRSLSSSFLAVVFVAVMACALLAVPALADSQARIVRLSDVQGNVQIDKNTGLGFENAFLNLPITQGTQLKTLTNGRVEIEFEDGSTVRLAPNSSVTFNTLGLNDSGKRTSVIKLVAGMAYVNWLGKDEFNLSFASEKISLDRAAAHFRVEASAQAADLAVFKGDVNVEGPSGTVAVTKKKTATFDVADNDKYTLANNINQAPLDSWDKESTEYHEQYAKNNQSASPYGYGLSDMNYYGSYSMVPGFGLMWQPFFTGVGWDPFMDGAWGFYPGFGYAFASPYPWGWLPYRYGNWNFIPGNGWMWQPGGWNSWLAVPHYTATNLVTVHPLVAPTGTVKTVVVGKGGPTPTILSPRMTVNRGSAGFGIPRGSLGNLKSLNHQVAKSGFAEVHPAPQFSASSPRSSTGFSGPHSSGTATSSAGHSSSMGHSSGGSSHH
jgi:hypothetical protein